MREPRCTINRAAVLAYLKAQGSATTAELRQRFGADRDADAFYQSLVTLAERGLLVNTHAGQGRLALWACPEDPAATAALAAKKAAAQKAAAAAEKAQAQAQCLYPRYGTEVAQPRRYDIRASVYQPAPWQPPRG